MPFTISYHKEVGNHDIPALPAAMKARMKSTIETKLSTYPEQYALPLRRTLKGYWKLRIGDYRVVFEFDRSTIIVLGIGHRKDIYYRMKRRMYP
ncbi:MAG TPA: type II toxin-antitoxin system RelE/ParE family toxin [Nitrospiraceae bacterium]|nr:type II toxin-antitoxin system RelE/ParE family toxin [Nitrospiraceae bacterium]